MFPEVEVKEEPLDKDVDNGGVYDASVTRDSPGRSKRDLPSGGRTAASSAACRSAVSGAARASAAPEGDRAQGWYSVWRGGVTNSCVQQVERFEPTAPQSAVPYPPLNQVMRRGWPRSGRGPPCGPSRWSEHKKGK